MSKFITDKVSFKDAGKLFREYIADNFEGRLPFVIDCRLLGTYRVTLPDGTKIGFSKGE